MRGLWLGLFAAVLIGGVAWGQDAGEDLIADIEAAAGAAEDEPAWSRRMYALNDLLELAEASGHAVGEGGAEGFIRAGLGAGYWARPRQLPTPEMAVMGPVMVLWHTPEGHTRMEVFLRDTLDFMADRVMARAQHPADKARRQHLAMREAFIPAYLAFLEIGPRIEAYTRIANPTAEQATRMEDMKAAWRDTLIRLDGALREFDKDLTDLVAGDGGLPSSE
ncbi:MAG: hypothetical protein AAF750_17075 [Planctomycetota bacterium]